MHVGLNLVFLVPGETGGMEVYARELIPALLAAGDGDVRFTAFVSREAAATDGPWREMPSVTVPVCSANRAEWVRGEQALLPRLAAAHRVDLVHSLATTAPGWGRFRRVTTIHDLHYRTIPEAHFGVRALGMRVLVPLSARRSHRVIADSQATRDDVVEFLRVPPARVDVVHLGLGRRARAEPEPFSAGGRRVLMTAAAKRPHKNLAALLDALALLPAEGRPLLVLPGYPTPHEEELKARAAALGIEGDVRFLGWVGDGQMEGLYAAADAFVFPSLSEGFGLPVLEAMASGTPVVAADRAALPEVAGGAAVLFDPDDPEGAAEALVGVVSDGGLAASLRARGLERAAGFTWRRAAEQVDEAIAARF